MLLLTFADLSTRGTLGFGRERSAAFGRERSAAFGSFVITSPDSGGWVEEGGIVSTLGSVEMAADGGTSSFWVENSGSRVESKVHE